MSEKNHDMENNIGMSAKHGMQLPSRISNGGGQRNSSIELLRIIAMFIFSPITSSSLTAMTC